MSPGIEVRYVLTAGLGEDHYQRLFEQLPAEEQATAQRYRFLKDRLAFVIGRALIRKTISELAPEPHAGWRFASNNFGKPSLQPNLQNLQFNLSHCTGLVAAAFTQDHEIGLDVESLERHSDILEVARAHFAPSEITALESQPQALQAQTFFQIWTFKEAYIKARGLGLSKIPLSAFAFTLNPLSLTFAPEIADIPTNWQLWQARPTANHMLSLCSARSSEGEQSIAMSETTFDKLALRS